MRRGQSVKKTEGPAGRVKEGNGARTRRKSLILAAPGSYDSPPPPVCVLPPQATPPKARASGTVRQITEACRSSRAGGHPVEEMQRQPADSRGRAELPQAARQGPWGSCSLSSCWIETAYESKAVLNIQEIKHQKNTTKSNLLLEQELCHSLFCMRRNDKITSSISYPVENTSSVSTNTKLVLGLQAWDLAQLKEIPSLSWSKAA